MTVFLTILYALAGLIALILLLLCIRVKFSATMIYTEKDGFSSDSFVSYGLFKKKLAKKKKTEKEKSEKEKKEEKDKSGITVKKITAITKIIKELLWIPPKVLKVEEQSAYCKVALKDPMKNGIVYASVSGALISVTELIVCKFKTEKYKVRVVPDFTSGDGISIKEVSKLSIVPIALVFCLIKTYIKSETLRENIKELTE